MTERLRGYSIVIEDGARLSLASLEINNKEYVVRDGKTPVYTTFEKPHAVQVFEACRDRIITERKDNA